jgi:hypothetical protein
MQYAVLQKELVAPDLEALKRACRVLPSLRDIDAQNMFQDAYGILIKGLDVVDASALQDALQAEGVHTIVVEESELPVIPPAKIIRQIEFLPAHLNMYDPMGRVFALPWQDIMLIAAGNVRVQEFRKAKTTYEDTALSGSAGSQEHPADKRPRAEANLHLMLEIFLVGGIARYSISGDTFDFAYLEERYSNSQQKNFCTLVQDLVEFAPHAGQNRGSYMATLNVEELFTYPSKATFHEELAWMLWRISQAKSMTGT